MEKKTEPVEDITKHKKTNSSFSVEEAADNDTDMLKENEPIELIKDQPIIQDKQERPVGTYNS